MNNTSTDSNSNVVVVKSSIITYPHGFSSRTGGVSSGIFDSLNLGMNRGDDQDKVIKNWDIFLKACDINTDRFVCGQQVHGNYVHIAAMDNARPAYGQGKLIEADGYATNVPGVPLAVFTADCVPVIMADEVNGVVASVHCGWRSTVADIEKSAVDAMVSLGAEVSNIKAATGPSIGKCCFEVGAEVIEAARDLLGELPGELYSDSANEGKYMLNLPGVVKCRLMQLGLKDENIEIIDECTMCHPERYWSHRYTKGERGSQANVVMIPEA